MKPRILELIENISNIERLFHIIEGVSGIPSSELIYDVQEFQNWLQEIQLELHDIIDRTDDTFVKGTLEAISGTFNGWNDRKDFNNIKGKLFAIQRNIHKYYKDGKDYGNDSKKHGHVKIFISHSSEDAEYVAQIVALLDGVGLNQTQVFCSSLPGYDIPLNTNIFDYLRLQFLEYKLHIIFVHSPNYYMSSISLNEMGAAWVLKHNHTSILLPGFGFSEMKGAVNADHIAIKLDNSKVEVKDKLNQLYMTIINEFGLTKKPDIVWEQKRDLFIREITRIDQSRKDNISNQGAVSSISAEAAELLTAAANDATGQVMKVMDLSGTEIQAGQTCMNAKGDLGDTARWDSALDELRTAGLVKQADRKGVIFQVTDSGYNLLEQED